MVEPIIPPGLGARARGRRNRRPGRVGGGAKHLRHYPRLPGGGARFLRQVGPSNPDRTKARAVLDGIRSDGNAWDKAETHLYSCGPGIPDDLRNQVGANLMHLDQVAPRRLGIDLRPFWTLGVAALMRDLAPDEVDPRVFERVMCPFVEVCGPLPKQLL